MQLAQASDAIREAHNVLIAASLDALPQQYEYESIVRMSEAMYAHANEIRRLAKGLQRRAHKAQTKFDRDMHRIALGSWAK